MKKRKSVKTKKAKVSSITKTTQCDFPIVILVTILTLFGVVMIFSASYYSSISQAGTPYQFLIKQGIFAILGFAIMYLMSNFNYHNIRRLSKPILLVTIICLLLLFTPFGVTANGSTRWLRIGITIMPGEIAKAAMIIFTAAYLSADIRRAKKLKNLVIVLGLAGIFFILIDKQPNLSTALTVVMIAVGMCFLAGMQWRYIGLMILGGLCLVATKTIGGESYQSDRIKSFIDPFAYAKGEGYQVVQSLMALGSGGIYGVGIGRSVQKTLYLPEPHTDFIMAIVGEELGLIGVIIVLLLFVILVWRCFFVSMKAPDRFGMLLAGGVGIMTAVQVLMNVAVVTSSMPPTGVAMPFITYGGNSLWIFMGMYGIVLNISRQSKKQETET